MSAKGLAQSPEFRQDVQDILDGSLYGIDAPSSSGRVLLVAQYIEDVRRLYEVEEVSMTEYPMLIAGFLSGLLGCSYPTAIALAERLDEAADSAQMVQELS